MKKQLAEKQKKVQSKEQKVKTQEDELKSQTKKVIEACKMVTSLVGQSLTYEALSSFTLGDQGSQIVEDLNLFEGNPVENQLIKLVDAISTSRHGLARKIQGLVQKQKSMGAELQEGNELKTEILSDFKRLQSQVESAQTKQKILEETNKNLEQELDEKREALSRA